MEGGGGCLSIFIKQKIRSVDLLITYVKKLIFFKVEKKNEQSKPNC